MEALPILERRTGDRVEINVSLACRIPASPVLATILDLTHNGCRVGFRNLRPELGGTISLEVANGDRVSGQIVWVDGSQAGVRFHRRLRSGTAIFLGVEQYEPCAEIEPPIPERSGGLISHWYRRLMGALSARTDRP